MYVYILVAITFAVTASVIAYSKGRNSLGWFLAGLLIGPFALVVAALSPVVREGQFARCVACGEVIRAEASVCRYCGTAVEHVEPRPPVEVAAAAEAG
ncbi:MAG: zinc ribbon domain-containing protein [Polyangiaceae bacterium]|jgi:hypothetical protein|nr:zinc ribbon domain-containing protein [Polyangiaceae bacterium]